MNDLAGKGRDSACVLKGFDIFYEWRGYHRRAAKSMPEEPVIVVTARGRTCEELCDSCPAVAWRRSIPPFDLEPLSTRRLRVSWTWRQERPASRPYLKTRSTGWPITGPCFWLASAFVDPIIRRKRRHRLIS